jgi:hypothetical protein
MTAPAVQETCQHQRLAVDPQTREPWCQDCGRYRGAGAHQCWFVCPADRAAAELRRGYEPLTWKAWGAAIDEDALREVEAAFPA